MLLYARGSETDVIDSQALKEALFSTFEKLGNKKKVLAIPPDFTRYHSRAGELTTFAYEFYQKEMTDILPALGTHFAMTEKEIDKMFPGVPQNLFRVHNWKNDLVTLGTVPSEFIKEVSDGRVDYEWKAQVIHALSPEIESRDRFGIAEPERIHSNQKTPCLRHIHLN